MSVSREPAEETRSSLTGLEGPIHKAIWLLGEGRLRGWSRAKVDEVMRDAAVALNAAEREITRQQDLWTLQSGVIREQSENFKRQLRLGTEDVRAERDEAVSLALWLAALDAVEIERRIEWVARITALYEATASARAVSATSTENQ